ncbi:nectin-1-like isoform X3 [Siniperca chuatsi]|uniref:nectin-1-like isoform X3 n=1 Tax=Siniperca chuatsi TaxID=119488 RepID=UPI001CE1DA03|nr:nectin-1-like isoform X3 [Siniperca chuatsi]
MPLSSSLSWCFRTGHRRICLFVTLYTMKTCSKSPLILLKLIYITLLPVLEAQEVTGYLGHDVTLPCQFIPGPKEANITQVQWELKPPEGEKFIILVFNVLHGVNTKDTFLKERVEIAEQSLIIRDVEMRDAGLYTCSIAAFPSGSFAGSTNLVVQDAVIIRAGFCYSDCCHVGVNDRGSHSLSHHQKIQVVR